MSQVFESDRSVLTRIRGRIARWLAPEIFELLRQKEQSTLPLGPGPEIKSLSSEDSADQSTTSVKGGPPAHWLKKVREGAPQLLLSEEEGGPPYVAAQTVPESAPPLNRPPGPQPLNQRWSVRADGGGSPPVENPQVERRQFTRASDRLTSWQETNVDRADLASPALPKGEEQRIEESQRLVPPPGRVSGGEVRSPDSQPREFRRAEDRKNPDYDRQRSQIEAGFERYLVDPGQARAAHRSGGGTARIEQPKNEFTGQRSRIETERAEIIDHVSPRYPATAQPRGRPEEVRAYREIEPFEISGARTAEQNRADRRPSQGVNRPIHSQPEFVSPDKRERSEARREPSSSSAKGREDAQERVIVVLREQADRDRRDGLPLAASERTSSRVAGRWPSLLPNRTRVQQSSTRENDLRRELFLLQEQRGGD